MTSTEFGARVISRGALAGAAAALVAAWGWGAPASGGVLVGAAVALLHFAWLARGVALGAPGARRPGARWIVALGTRYLVTFAALAAPVALEWAHPVALGVGVTVLPLALTAAGLRAARPAG